MQLHIRNRYESEPTRKLASKKAAALIPLGLIASHVVVNSALAVSDGDFSRLEQRVRMLEAKVFNTQELARIPICQKISLLTESYNNAKDEKYRFNYQIEQNPMSVSYCSDVWSGADKKCVENFKAEGNKKLDLKIGDIQKSLQSALMEAQAAGVVCPK